MDGVEDDGQRGKQEMMRIRQSREEVDQDEDKEMEDVGKEEEGMQEELQVEHLALMDGAEVEVERVKQEKPFMFRFSQTVGG